MKLIKRGGYEQGKADGSRGLSHGSGGMMTPAIIMIILKPGMRRGMKRGIMKVQVNLRGKMTKRMNSFNCF